MHQGSASPADSGVEDTGDFIAGRDRALTQPITERELTRAISDKELKSAFKKKLIMHVTSKQPEALRVQNPTSPRKGYYSPGRPSDISPYISQEPSPRSQDTSPRDDAISDISSPRTDDEMLTFIQKYNEDIVQANPEDEELSRAASGGGLSITSPRSEVGGSASPSPRRRTPVTPRRRFGAGDYSADHIVGHLRRPASDIALAASGRVSPLLKRSFGIDADK